MEKYKLRIAHLYGDLMNTYGDYGNILILKYYGKRLGIDVTSAVVSLNEGFKADDYDMAILGDGQFFEQSIVLADLLKKKTELVKFVNKKAPVLAIGEGYQLLGKYYVNPAGKKITGLGIMNHHTIQQSNHDLMGNIKVTDSLNKKQYHGFEHHNDMTFLGDKEQPLGKVIDGTGGNNNQDDTEGARYRNVYCTYLHGPILTRNPELAKWMLITALKNKYPDHDFSDQKAITIAPSY